MGAPSSSIWTTPTPRPDSGVGLSGRPSRCQVGSGGAGSSWPAAGSVRSGSRPRGKLMPRMIGMANTSEFARTVCPPTPDRPLPGLRGSYDLLSQRFAQSSVHHARTYLDLRRRPGQVSYAPLMFNNQRILRCNRLNFVVKTTEGRRPADSSCRCTSSKRSIIFRATGQCPRSMAKCRTLHGAVYSFDRCFPPPFFPDRLAFVRESWKYR